MYLLVQDQRFSALNLRPDKLGQEGHKNCTYDTVGMLRPTEDGRQPEIADLDLTEMAIDKDVVTLQVPVDYWRIMAVEVSEAAEDLAGPVLHCSNVYSGVLSSVPVSYPNNSINSILMGVTQYQGIYA